MFLFNLCLDYVCEVCIMLMYLMFAKCFYTQFEKIYDRDPTLYETALQFLLHTNSSCGIWTYDIVRNLLSVHALFIAILVFILNSVIFKNFKATFAKPNNKS
jgi:hypothetical protein